MLIPAILFTTTDVVVGKTPEKTEIKTVKYEHKINCNEITETVSNHVDNGVKTIKAAEEESHWENIGYVRCTEYCPSCNSPSGHRSSSGAYLTDGHVACSWLKLGTRIRINGFNSIQHLFI